MSNYSSYPEAELVDLLKGRDEKAYSYLYDHYSAALYGVVLRVLNSEEAARDVLQDVFVKIWRNIQSYDAGKGRLYTWMLNIARNTAIDVLRSRRFKDDQKIRELDNAVHVNVPAMSTTMFVDHVGLSKVMDQLSEEQQRLLNLAYFRGYTQEEISKELEIPLGTVKTRIRNTLIQLRNILQRS